MYANESSAAAVRASQSTWLTVITVSYCCDHPSGYRSCIDPTDAGGFAAYVEIAGLVRLHAPAPFSSLRQAQAWCLDEQRHRELKELY